MRRYVYFWLNVVFSVVLPLAIVNAEWPLFYEAGQFKASGTAIVLSVVIIWYAKDHFNTYVRLLRPSAFKTALIALLNAMPMIILYVILQALETTILRAQFVVMWIALSWLIAGVFKALHIEIIEPLLIAKGLNK